MFCSACVWLACGNRTMSRSDNLTSGAARGASLFRVAFLGERDGAGGTAGADGGAANIIIQVSLFPLILYLSSILLPC